MAARTKPNEIAVIGMSGRFPGAPDLDRFWLNLENGVESISRYTEEELLQSGVDQAVISSPQYVAAGAPIDDIDKFDAAFFGYSPRDAETMDPQHRLFLECAWHAFEDAGYDIGRCGGSVGVFGGCAMSSYLFQLHRNPEFMASVGFLPSLIGNDKDYLTTHVSYKLNLTGPSVTVQTACSTGLVAVVTACKSLLDQECDMALAGASTIRVPHRVGYQYLDGGIYSPDGHCRAFDTAAEGTVFGNGVGVVLLKRLEDAVRDDDDIYAVVKGYGINNDGATKLGYTAPSPEGQARVILAAHAMAGVSADTIGFVETHGTGTKLGDPIEIEALTHAFRHSTDRAGFCAIGSVKTNVGHLDPAAGIVSFIKTVQALHQQVIPPSLNFSEPNPEIDFPASPFFVATEALPWPTNGSPRRAGVSAFGIGGTNVHAVLEEAPPRRRRRNHAKPNSEVLLLSAKTSASLDETTRKLTEHLRSHDLVAADVAFTLQEGRMEHGVRRAVIFSDGAGLSAKLATRDWIDGEKPTGQDRPIAFMFPGQGSQYPDMGRELYETVPAFRRVLDTAAKRLQSRLGLDLRDVLYPPGGMAKAATKRLAETWLTQPALFTVEYALARTLQSWGITPTALIGHSLGEYVAACLAGVLKLGDALEIVADRGRLMHELPRGAMVAVMAEPSAVAPLLPPAVSIAAVNAPDLCVVSGPSAGIEVVEAILAEHGFAAQRLPTARAFHSGMMDSIIPAFAEIMASHQLSAPQIPIISNLTGTWLTPEQAVSPFYWTEHLRQTVAFGEGVRRLLDSGYRLVEVGPGHILGGLAARSNSSGKQARALSTMPSSASGSPARDHLLDAVARLWVDGTPVDWVATRKRPGRRVHLPGYSFERKRLWVEPEPRPKRRPEPRPARGPSAAASPRASARKRRVRQWFYVPAWEERPAEQPLHLSDQSDDDGWLVIGAETALGRQLTRRLRESGRRVASVQAGAAFRRDADGRYRINPAAPEDYQRLLASLREDGSPCSHVLHLWTVGEVPASSSRERFTRTQERGFYSLLWLTRALAASGLPATGVNMATVSSGLHSVTGDEPLFPAKATVLGPVKTITQEYPRIGCVSIDLDPRDLASDDLPSLADQVISATQDRRTDSFLAYRRGSMFARAYEPGPLPMPYRTPYSRYQGTYIITGGLGNLGLLLAEDLAASTSARLALITRSPLPPATEWRERAKADDATGRKLRSLLRIEDLGSEVLICVADLTRPEDIGRAVRETLERFGSVNGLIHAAGCLRPEAFPFIETMSVEACQMNLDPKAGAIGPLVDELKGQELDFVLLISSIAVALGGLGYSAYAAANHYLDAFAKRRNRQRRCRFVAVELDQMDFATDRSDTSILPGEALDVFHRILAGTEDHVAVSVTPIDEREGRWAPEAAEPLDPPTVRPSRPVRVVSEPSDRSSTPLDASPPPPPRVRERAVADSPREEDAIGRVWSEILGVVDPSPSDNFFTDLGGHSLLATQAAARLRAELQLDIPLRMLFEFPTLETLAPALRGRRSQNGATELPGAITAVSREAHRIHLDEDGHSAAR